MPLVTSHIKQASRAVCVSTHTSVTAAAAAAAETRAVGPNAKR